MRMREAVVGVLLVVTSLVVVTPRVHAEGSATDARAGAAEPAASTFADVPDSHPFSTAISWMATRGLTTGYPDSTFAPAATVTRQSAAAFLYRLAGSPDGDEPPCNGGIFNDVLAGHPYCGEITWMVDEGITSGYPDNTFRPTDAVTRQSIAAFLYRFAGSPNGTAPTCSIPAASDVPIDQPFCGQIAWMISEGIAAGYADGSFAPGAPVTRQAIASFLYKYPAPAAQVATGVDNSCALVSTGAIRCWGPNSSGQLGNGTFTDSSTPVAVAGITNATHIAVAGSHSCAILSTGTVKCWGENESGQLGNGTFTDSPTPVAVSGITNAVTISAAGSRTCATLASGAVNCWGFSGYDLLLGNGAFANSPWPVTVTGITDAAMVTVGANHTCVVLASGIVTCWGNNGVGQLGDGTTTGSSTPVTVAGITNATTIDAGSTHTCAVLATHIVRCWGFNYHGQLGNGTTTGSSTPVTVTGITDATTVAAGYDHSCATLASGTVTCWGSNYYGLGDGATNDSSTPVTVAGITNGISVTVGLTHSCALLAPGTTRCWGGSYYGQLGRGTTMASSTPVTVYGLG